MEYLVGFMLGVTYIVVLDVVMSIIIKKRMEKRFKEMRNMR